MSATRGKNTEKNYLGFFMNPSLQILYTYQYNAESSVEFKKSNEYSFKQMFHSSFQRRTQHIRKI